MKVDSTGIVVYSEGIQSESFFTVKQDNLAHIFGILRNQLYSNKYVIMVSVCLRMTFALSLLLMVNQPSETLTPKSA
jgi:hypothetical protein